MIKKLLKIFLLEFIMFCNIIMGEIVSENIGNVYFIGQLVGIFNYYWILKILFNGE